jgi:hypothetical protein
VPSDAPSRKDHRRDPDRNPTPSGYYPETENSSSLADIYDPFFAASLPLATKRRRLWVCAMSAEMPQPEIAAGVFTGY